MIMLDLTKLSIQLDHLHRQLFESYEELLGLKLIDPKVYFLSDDCFTPYDDECYSVIAYSWQSIITIMEMLKKIAPAEVHQHLRIFNYFLLQIKKAFQPETDEQSEQPVFIEIRALSEGAEKFLSEYSYKLTPEYQANNAILLACMLYESAKMAFTPNVAAEQPILTQKQTKEILSLANVAQKI